MVQNESGAYHVGETGTAPVVVVPLGDLPAGGNSSAPPCSNDYCVSDEEYVDMIEAYIWPEPFEWGLIAFYMLVFIVGLVGNFLVCLAVWRNHHMRTVTNYFIVNLAVADFLVILVCLPPTVMGDVTETWYMGMVMCKVVQYLQLCWHLEGAWRARETDVTENVNSESHTAGTTVVDHLAKQDKL